MPAPLIEVQFTPKDLPARFERYPKQLDREASKTMRESIEILHNSVPQYVPERPGQRYKRTGDLGASLGVGMSGRPIGTPDIFTARRIGDNSYVGVFGSLIRYGPLVIGEGTQAFMHVGRWWTIRTVRDRASNKITKAWLAMSERLVSFLGK